jgi:hypothetical protein
MKRFLSTHMLYEQGRTTTVTETETGIPDDLAEMLVQTDGNSYAGGFFKFIVPDAFRHYVAMWNLDPAECIPFLKCAFGHVIFYHQEQYKTLNPVYNCIDVLGEGNELDFVMDVMLCDRQGLEHSFCIDLYEQLSETLGVPNLDEMYAFIPAIGLGGSRSAEHVHKVNMNKEMTILSRL